MAIFVFEISMPILFTSYHIVTSNHKLVFMTAWMIAKRPFPKILCPPAVNIIHGLNENNILIFLPTQILVTAISSAAKQNDRLHELYLAQGMAKNLLFNFILLPNF